MEKDKLKVSSHGWRERANGKVRSCEYEGERGRGESEAEDEEQEGEAGSWEAVLVSLGSSVGLSSVG